MQTRVGVGGTEVGRSATAGIVVVSEEEVGETEWTELQSRIGVGRNEVGGSATTGI